MTRPTIRRHPRRRHHCHAAGCTLVIRAGDFMCPAHWRHVPYTTKQTMQRHDPAGGRPSILWLAAARSAIDAVADTERHARQGRTIR